MIDDATTSDLNHKSQIKHHTENMNFEHTYLDTRERERLEVDKSRDTLINLNTFTQHWTPFKTHHRSSPLDLNHCFFDMN